MRALDEIRERRQTRMRARFHHVKHLHARYLVKRQIATGKIDSIDKATSWIKGEFADMLRERTMRTMGLSAEEHDHKGAPHFAGYWTGSSAGSGRAVVVAQQSTEALAALHLAELL